LGNRNLRGHGKGLPRDLAGSRNDFCTHDEPGILSCV
jgi:hypothetical protein